MPECTECTEKKENSAQILKTVHTQCTKIKGYALHKSQIYNYIKSKVHKVHKKTKY